MRVPARRHPDIELKAIRRVRTPSGAQHYGQPIGTIIVADAPDFSRVLSDATPRRTLKKPSPRVLSDEDTDSQTPGRTRAHKLNRATSEYEGWKKWRHGKNSYYTGREDDGVWIATDKDDYVLAEGPTEGEALRGLEANLGFPDRVKPASMSHMHPLKSHEEKMELEAKFNVKIPPGLGQIHVADLDTTQRNVFGGIQSDGSWRVFPSKVATEAAAEQKWARISALKPYIAKLDKALAKAPIDDPVALAVLIMRDTAMRVSSSRGQVGEKHTYGATSLQVRHVKFNQNSATFTFIGKDGVPQSLNTKNQDLIRRLQHHVEGKGPRDELTPGVRDKSTIDYIRTATGNAEFKNHDLRTFLANVIAYEVLQGYMKRKKPKTKAEFKKMRTHVGDVVSKQLGNNRTMALNSYVNPALFLPFAEEGWM